MNTKHNLLLIFLLFFTVSSVFADVGIWDRFETSITHTKSVVDPYRDTTLNVMYTRPDGSKIQFWGFYDGGATWTIRFMPDMPGSWKYSAAFSDGQPGKSGSFNCVPSDLPGMISQDEVNPLWFGYKGGNHMIMRSFHVGDRFFAANWPATGRKAFLDWVQKQGYNTLSIGSHYLNRDDDTRGRGWDTPDLWDNASRKLKNAEYDEMEVILDDLAKRRIIVHPFGGFLGANSDYPKNSSDRTLYFKYTLARLGSYWNVMLNVAGPELAKWTLSESEVTTIGKEIQSLDVFGHLLACHQTSNKNFFKNQSWNNYDCYQGTKTHDLNKLYTELSETFRSSGEPFYAHETLWSGNKNHPGYSDTQLRKNAIVITMAAAALNFGDMNGNSSSGFSGSLDLADVRQARHDIVKRVWDFFETIEFWKMSPRPDLARAGYCLAKAGEEYLVYRPSRGSITIHITGGPYIVTWVNAQDTSERINGGIATNGQNLSTPGHGDDWFCHLTQDKPDPTPTTTRASANGIRPVRVARGAYPDLVMDSTGNVHIVYVRNGTLRYRKYNAATKSFEAEKDTGLAQGQVERSDPEIVADSQDRPHVFVGSSYAYWNGSSWVKINPNVTRDTATAIDAHDNIYIVKRGGSNGGKMGLQRRIAGGSEFIALPDPDINAGFPASTASDHVYGHVFVNPVDNAIHIVYRHAVPKEISSRVSFDGGQGWKGGGISSDRGETPSGVAHTDGTVYCITADGTAYQLTSSPGTWSSRGGALASGPRDLPALATDQSGNLYAGSFGGRYNVRRNGSWLGAKLVPRLSGQDLGFMEVVRGSGDYVYAVYEEGNTVSRDQQAGESDIIFCTIDKDGAIGAGSATAYKVP